MEKDDTAGCEIRHGEYFEHLDMLIIRIQLVDQEQKEKAGGRNQQINEVREETAQRLQTLETRQEERQLGYERHQLKMEETNNQILLMLGQVLAQKGNGKDVV